MASTPRVTSASRAVGAPSTRGGTPLEVALRDWLSELRLSNRSQTTIDWYRDLFQGGRSVSMVTALKVVRALERNPPNERLIALHSWREAHPRQVVPSQLVTARDR